MHSEKQRGIERDRDRKIGTLPACLSFPFDATALPSRRNKRFAGGIFLDGSHLQREIRGDTESSSKYRVPLFISGCRRCLGKHDEHSCGPDRDFNRAKGPAFRSYENSRDSTPSRVAAKFCNVPLASRRFQGLDNYLVFRMHCVSGLLGLLYSPRDHES